MSAVSGFLTSPSWRLIRRMSASTIQGAFIGVVLLRVARSPYYESRFWLYILRKVFGGVTIRLGLRGRRERVGPVGPRSSCSPAFAPATFLITLGGRGSPACRDHKGHSRRSILG